MGFEAKELSSFAAENVHHGSGNGIIFRALTELRHRPSEPSHRRIAIIISVTHGECTFFSLSFISLPALPIATTQATKPQAMEIAVAM